MVALQSGYHHYRAIPAFFPFRTAISVPQTTPASPIPMKNNIISAYVMYIGITQMH